MTEYTIEFYKKGARKPYQRFDDVLPSRTKPTYVDSKQCFNYKLMEAPRVRIYYKNNGKLVAKSYVDENKEKRIRWL